MTESVSSVDVSDMGGADFEDSETEYFSAQEGDDPPCSEDDLVADAVGPSELEGEVVWDGAASSSRGLDSTRPRRSTCDYNFDYDDFKGLNRRERRQLQEDLRKRRKNTHAALLSIVPEDLRAVDVMIPSTYEEAMTGKYVTQWRAAIKSELGSLLENKTWSDGKAPVIPPGKKCVKTKWVFDVKRNEKGKVTRFKARLVAKGFTQRRGVDYNATFSPVMQPALLRSLLAVAAYEDWEIHQVDIRTAFLYGSLDEEIYIELPNGEKRRLKSAFYGLKQAGRQFNLRLHNSFSRFGLKRIDGDPCCYFNDSKDSPLIALVHVDDVVIFGKDVQEIQKLKKALKNEYKISDGGAIKYCLGWEIKRDRKKRLLSINQEQYVLDSLKRFGFEGLTPAKTPACPHTIMSEKMCPATDEERRQMKGIPYLAALGTLLYLATSTRPDIAFAVSELARFAKNPGLDHWMGIKRVFRYLKGSSGFGLMYGKGTKRVFGYVDSNYARCVDTRRSRYGGVLLLNGGATDWRSKMESIVALSSMEAEYIGACEFVRLGVWLQRCLKDLKLGEDGDAD